MDNPSARDAGEPVTIESIINQYGRYVYNMALSLSSNPENAEDLAQETLIQAWKHLTAIKNPAAIKKWLHTICINEFRMMLRKENRENISYVENLEDLEKDGRLLVNVSPTAIDELQTAEEVAKVRDGCFLAMARKLTLNQRLTFSLIDMFDLSVTEVAVILDLTPKAVQGLLYRARMNLDAFFQGHCSFLDIGNPCSCIAWIGFMQERTSWQETMAQKVQTLDYKEKDYRFDPHVRQMILHYYQNIPTQQPPKAWYAKVISLIEQIYK